ncbi:MAG: hypothetical protein ACI4J1_03040, partial [Ruminiclostridium sp.]
MNDKYYLFTGDIDLSECHLVNVTTEKNADGEMLFGKGGIMISPCLDSGEKGTVWDKAEIVYPTSQNGYFCFTAFSSDSMYAEVGGQKTPVSRILEDIASGRQLSEFDSDITAVRFINPDNAPLHGLKGRYLWFIAEAFPEKDGAIAISSIKIRYPHISLMNALPEIIRRTDNGNLASMLALYKTVFDKLDSRIVNFDDELDIDLAQGEALKRLVSWQGVPVSDIWGEEILRRVTRES